MDAQKGLYTMSAPERGESGEITAEAQIPANSRWFCGHFPDDPVLPAIAQLGMLVDMIARAEKHPLRLASASRFKFKPGSARKTGLRWLRVRVMNPASICATSRKTDRKRQAASLF